MTLLANQVYTAALKLMGEESENGTDTGYTTEYQAKAWVVLDILQRELLPPGSDPYPIEVEDEVISVDDYTARMVLPYGLAAHLLMEEDPQRAGFFNARYDELKRRKKATVTTITDVYGVAGGGG